MRIKDLSRRQMQLMLFRLSVGYPGWLMLTYSVQVLPLGLCQTLQNLTPFMVLLMSYFALKETLKVFEIVNMLISFVGVIFIVSMAQRNESDTKKEVDSSDFIIGIICNALSAVFFSMINVIIRSLK